MKNNDICKWFHVCPLKEFYEQGILNEKWIKDYCYNDHLRCQRYRMEEKGIYHPDNMMPDGTIEEGLNDKKNI